MKANCQSFSDDRMSRISEDYKMQGVSEVGGRHVLSIRITIVCGFPSKHIHSFFSATNKAVMLLQYSDKFLVLKIVNE